jgi:hypothetical protein
VSLVVVHERLSVTCAFFAFAMGVWGVALAARGRGPDGNYLGAAVIGELLLLAQSGLGAWLLFGEGLSPGRSLHLLYGVTVLVVWPFLMSYTRRESGPREALLFGAGSFFLFGLVLRAATTGATG